MSTFLRNWDSDTAAQAFFHIWVTYEILIRYRNEEKWLCRSSSSNLSGCAKALCPFHLAHECFKSTHSGNTNEPILIKLDIYRTTHWRPPGTQTLTSIRRRGWSGSSAFFVFVAKCVRSGPIMAQNASFRASKCLLRVWTMCP